MSTEQQRVGAPRRYLTRLTRGTLAVIMAGGRGERLKQLTEAESILEKLLAHGVDNWEWYGDAMAEWEEENG